MCINSKSRCSVERVDKFKVHKKKIRDKRERERERESESLRVAGVRKNPRRKWDGVQSCANFLACWPENHTTRYFRSSEIFSHLFILRKKEFYSALGFSKIRIV